MSRTFNENHPTAHNPKNRVPNPFLDKEGKIERRRKRRAYGSKKFGEETYFKKYGEVLLDAISKKKERQEAKIYINNELQNQL